MRTTVNLDDDVVRAAKVLAQQRGQTLGRVLSDYFRAALRPPGASAVEERNGIPLLPRRPGAFPVTPESVRELLEAGE